MNSRIEELNRVALIVEGDAELHEGAERSVPAPGHELDVDRILGRREGLVVVCRI